MQLIELSSNNHERIAIPVSKIKGFISLTNNELGNAFVSTGEGEDGWYVLEDYKYLIKHLKQIKEK